MSKKINIKRTDGIVQGYHVGSGADNAPQTNVLPTNVANPYLVSSEQKSSPLDRLGKTSSKDNYKFMLDYVEEKEPQLFAEYKNLASGRDLSSSGFKTVIDSLDKQINANQFNVSELNSQAKKLLSNFGHSNPDSDQMNMAIVSIISTHAIKELNDEHNISDMSDEEYLRSVASLRISQDILNTNLMSREPGH